MAKFKVLLTDTIFLDQEIEQRALQAIDAELVVAPASDEASLIAAAGDADALLVIYANITAKVIRAAKRCRVIARTGIGTNNIDVAAASAQGIVVTNVPDYCFAEVADHTLALILTCLRKTAYLSQTVKGGAWDNNLARPIARLSSLTAGLVGFGNIAQAVATRIKAFGMRVLAVDPYVGDAVFAQLGATRADTLGELAEAADVLSLHLPLTAKTQGIINADILARMKKGSWLINTSRGPLIDEAALVEALRAQSIAGCGLDVLAVEPCDFTSPLLQFPNVLLTPHVAFYSDGSEIELREKAVNQVILALSGEQPAYWINKA
jgi:D-3-phosphoglycerate dehydrogenase